jgi:hypothetical protein
MLQLASLVKRANRNFDKRRLAGPGYMDVVKVFDTVWVDGLAYKLEFLVLEFFQVCNTERFKCSSNQANPHVLACRLVCATQSVRERYACIILPCFVSAVCRLHGFHSHVLQFIYSHQVPGNIAQ